MKPIIGYCSNLLKAIATEAASAIEYDTWSDEFCREQLCSIRKWCHQGIIQEMLDSITADDVGLLKLLGWQVWKEDDNGNMLLCVPLYCKMALAEGVKLYSIFGKYKEVRDNDHRFGALAYGVLLNTKGNPVSTKFLAKDD
jgi:hypothetical protein|nr:MAG TPA: hypothetical protein [Caudoviricetes sp.]